MQSADSTKAHIMVRPHRNEVAWQFTHTTGQPNSLPTGWKIWHNSHYVGRIDSMHISYPQWGIEQRGYIHSQSEHVWEVGEFWECVYDLCHSQEENAWDKWYAENAVGAVIC